MPARRKLFLTHAGELAHLLVAAIARDAMVIEFVRRYAERHDRLKVVANVERLREMDSIISREALLLVAAEVRGLLPRAFGLSRNPKLEELELCDIFYKEFLEALGRNLEWPLTERETEAEAFRRDLETYTSWHHRDGTAPAKAKTGSPFPDRCAILLDSAMMDQARRAATKFQSDLLHASKRIFDRLGRPTLRRKRASGNRGSAGNPSHRRTRTLVGAANSARKHKAKTNRSARRRR